MEIKQKKCKGTGKAVGYGCGLLVPVSRFNKSNRVYGLGKSCGCYMNWLLNTDAGKQQLQKVTLKATETSRSLEKAFKDKKQKDGIVPHLENTKQAVHEMVRERDKGKPCISCGTPWNNTFQAGHCFNANNYRSIKFYFLNIHGQCEQCNLYKDGNVTEYLIRLPNRIGQIEFDKLKRLAALDKKINKKYYIEELKQIKAEARLLTKQIKK